MSSICHTPPSCGVHYPSPRRIGKYQTEGNFLACAKGRISLSAISDTPIFATLVKAAGSMSLSSSALPALNLAPSASGNISLTASAFIPEAKGFIGLFAIANAVVGPSANGDISLSTTNTGVEVSPVSSGSISLGASATGVITP